MARKSRYLWRSPLVLLCFLLAPAYAEETFPLPEELQPDVDFWRSIFTEYSTNEGVLHDNRDLRVIYKRVDMPSTLGRRDRSRRIRQHRDEIAATLRTLASGKRENLSTEEARVLALWPSDVSNDTLRAAAGQIRF